MTGMANGVRWLFDRFQLEYFFLSCKELSQRKKKKKKKPVEFFQPLFSREKKLRITNCPPTTLTQNMSLGSICGINRPKTWGRRVKITLVEQTRHCVARHPRFSSTSTVLDKVLSRFFLPSRLGSSSNTRSPSWLAAPPRQPPTLHSSTAHCMPSFM